VLALIERAPANARQPLTDVLAKLLGGDSVGAGDEVSGYSTALVPATGTKLVVHEAPLVEPPKLVPPLKLSGDDAATPSAGSLLITLRNSQPDQTEITSVRLKPR